MMSQNGQVEPSITGQTVLKDSAFFLEEKCFSKTPHSQIGNKLKYIFCINISVLILFFAFDFGFLPLSFRTS